MAPKATETAVRNYLLALKDPTALRDEERIANLRKELEEASDPIERVRLQQALTEAEQPNLEPHEAAFIEHVKPWADNHGISGAAFVAEGVAADVLRRAGFRDVAARGRRAAAQRRRGRRGPATTGGTRVSAEEVRAAIPKGKFTSRQLQEATGASYGVVRRVLGEEVETGRVKELGPDPDHTGRGRVPTLYRR